MSTFWVVVIALACLAVGFWVGVVFVLIEIKDAATYTIVFELKQKDERFDWKAGTGVP